MPEQLGSLKAARALGHTFFDLHIQEEHRKFSMVQHRAGDTAQHPFPPEGLAVRAHDDEVGTMTARHFIEGIGGKAGGDFDGHLEPLRFQLRFVLS